jgi:hypothetical protein
MDQQETQAMELSNKIEDLFDGQDPAVIMTIMCEKLGKAGHLFDMSKEEYLGKLLMSVHRTYDFFEGVEFCEEGLQ